MRLICFGYFFGVHKLRRLLGWSKKLGPVERRFCDENQIPIQGMRTQDVFGLFGRYEQGPLMPQIHAMVIPKRKRFGNALLQLADAYNIAKKLGVKKIYHRGYTFLKDEAQIDDVLLIKGIPSNAENYLIGDFYENNSLLNLCEHKLDRWQIVHNMSEYISLNVHSEQASDTSDVLYIHLRSGDIFKKMPPHRDYGQPPLAFYTKIIRHKNWRKVVLVFEDRHNPVINALIDLLDQQNIECQTFSGDIHQDVDVLLQAKHLVIARGTFIYPILSLSQNAQEVFYFEIDEHSPWGLENSHIHFRKCVDVPGDYRRTILTRWENDAEQNALMLSYSENNISIGE